MTIPTVAMPGGGAMPLLGFGTWRLRGQEGLDAISAALDAGYRHLDTATMYGNEDLVGAALGSHQLPRSEVFVTTKVPPRQAANGLPVLAASLQALQLDAVDLWLLHAPPPDLVRGWETAIRAQADGLARDIGVSNFSLDQIDELVRRTGVLPAVNQIDWSPFRYDARTVQGHRERGVVLEGYSTLKGGTLDDPVVRRIAAAHARTPAQVLIRWHLEHGIVVIPKSSRPERIVSNADVDFTLPEADVAALDALGRP